MVDFFVPGLPRDAAEQLYVRLEKEAGDRPRITVTARRADRDLPFWLPRGGGIRLWARLDPEWRIAIRPTALQLKWAIDLI
jgi:hypothetical protein